MAHEIIRETHPLNDTPIDRAFPSLKPFTYFFKKKIEEEMKEPLLEE
jgi:hypothetical protein